MDTALEQVKRAEQDAEYLLSEAKEKIAIIKRDTSDKIKAMENKYYDDLKQIQLAQTENESAILATQISSLDAQWEVEKNELNKSIALLKQDVIGALVGKVIGDYGDSNG